MDLDTLVPAGGGSLSRPVLGPHRVPVATFTPAQTPHPDELWQPFTRVTGMTADGQQGDPLGGYRPGHGIGHEPLDQDEKQSQHTAQIAAPHAIADSMVRSAMRHAM